MNLNTLHTAEQIDKAICQQAREIERLLGSQEDIIVLPLLHGALFYAADLLRKLPCNYILSSLRVGSYGESHESSGVVHIDTPIPKVAGKIVLILDDVIDTGLTLCTIKKCLLEAGAKEVYTAVAIDKKPCRRCDFEADFVALSAESEFLIGYGLDDAERYRNLPYIAVLGS